MVVRKEPRLLVAHLDLMDSMDKELSNTLAVGGASFGRLWVRV